MVLREAWKKKIKVDVSLIYFDHDYPSEIVKKTPQRTHSHKEAAQKEKHLFINSGHKHENTLEVGHTHIQMRLGCLQRVEETRISGWAVVPDEEDQLNAVSQLRDLLGWHSAKGNGVAVAMRAKAKLQCFQRDPVV